MPRLLMRCLLLMLLCLLSVPAIAEEADTVRPEIGKPLQDAQKLLGEHHAPEALAKVKEAERVKDRTPYETFLLQQIRGRALDVAGDSEAAIRDYDAAIASGRLTAPQKLLYTKQIAVDYYNLKNYPKAIEATNRYFKEGGDDDKMRIVLAQAYFLANDFANAVKELKAQTEAQERSHQTPPELQLQMLSQAAQKAGDPATTTAGLEKLASYYPKKEYWSALLQDIRKRPGYSGRLDLDLGRLRLATGAVRSPDDYMEAAQLALADGLPGEARKIVEQGYASGSLGTGAEAERHQRLKTLAAKSAEEDLKTIDQSATEAATRKDGTGLVNTGLDYVGYGQFDRGLALIEQGIQKGGLKYPDDAKLHQGFAYLQAGKKDKAIEAFQTIQGTDITAGLARAWLIVARRKAP